MMTMTMDHGYGHERWIWIMDYIMDWTMIMDLVWTRDDLAHARIA